MLLPFIHQAVCVCYIAVAFSQLPHTLDRQTHSFPHHIVEDEAGVGEFEVFEQAVEFAAVQGTPGTVKIVSGLRLLPRVVVVQELNTDRPQ